MNKFENQPAGGGTLRYGETIRGEEPPKALEHDTMREDAIRTVRGVGDEGVAKESEGWGLEKVETLKQASGGGGQEALVDYHEPEPAKVQETLKGVKPLSPEELAVAAEKPEAAPKMEKMAEKADDQAA